MQIAAGAGDLTQPGELALEVIDALLWEDSLDLGHCRACAANRDPEIVQELGIEVEPDALLIGSDHLDESSVDGRQGGLGRHVRIQSQIQLGSVATRLEADEARGLCQNRLGHRLQSESLLQSRSQRAELLVVALDRQGGERDRHLVALSRTLRSRDPAAIEAKPRDGLLAFVQEAERGALGLEVESGQQPAHLENLAQLAAEGSLRQILGEPRFGRDPDPVLAGTVQPFEHEVGNPSVLAQGQDLTGSEQPPVEGVEIANGLWVVRSACGASAFGDRPEDLFCGVSVLARVSDLQ